MLLDQCNDDCIDDINSALNRSVLSNHHKIVAILLKRFGNKIVSQRKKKAFQDAIYYGSHDVVQVIIQECANEHDEKFKYAALAMAIAHSQYTVIHILLKAWKADIILSRLFHMISSKFIIKGKDAHALEAYITKKWRTLCTEWNLLEPLLHATQLSTCASLYGEYIQS